MLPIILDEKEAIDIFNDPSSNDAIKVFAIKHLHIFGLKSRDIGKIFPISKYQLSHYARSAKKLTDEEIELWSNNPRRITFGHIRSLIRLPTQQRLDLIKDLATKRRLSVRNCEQISRGETATKNTDIKAYETELSEKLGRGIRIRYNQSNKTGQLTLDFFTLNDLEDIISVLHTTQSC